VSDGGWSFGGSILTFAFPMLLFIVVAVVLYVLYTKPTVVPGHRTSPVERPVSHTAIPGTAIPGTATATAIPGTATATEVPGTPTATEVPGNPAVDDPEAADGENAAPEAQE
jgi:hypothetical protein